MEIIFLAYGFMLGYSLGNWITRKEMLKDFTPKKKPISKKRKE